jgi:hypothetical protein
MPHRIARSRRYAGRAVVLSVLGWALFSRDRDELADDPAEERPLDFDVDWDIPALDVPEPATAPKDSARARVRPKRRLATSLAFATLFFAGAALSAGAGDMVTNALESTGSTSTETTTEASEEESAPVEEPAPVEEAEPPAEEPPTESEAPGDGDVGTEPGDGDEGAGEGPTNTGPDDAEQPDEGPEPDGGSDTIPDGDGSNDAEDKGGNSGNENSDHDGSSEPAGPPLIDLDSSPVSGAAPPDPEVAAAGSAATIWLHRSLPDPTPAARRLTPAFAQALRTEAARARSDWALVLGVLRAEGRVGRVPATRATLRGLSTRLRELGARRDEWAAVLALRGRTAFADRAVAGARFHRAVGLRAVVTGLKAAKPALERALLADSRISVYAGGRADVAAHRIDIRVVVALRYLAEAFGQVTVSSLQSGHRLYARPGVVSAHVYGLAVDIAALGGLSIVGNQAPGSVTEQAVRAILLLPAGLQPRQVISLIGLGGASFAMANHDDHIHVGF